MDCFLVLIAAVLLSSRCAVASTQRKGQLVQAVDGPNVPWLQPFAWKPPYGGLENNLSALLKSRSSKNWVSLFCLSLPATATDYEEEASLLRLSLNTLYSYRVFGQMNSDMVAALSPRALTVCQRFRLPCYNATAYTSGHSYKNIGWAKIKLSRDILKLGFHLHLSDLDVSYVKPLSPAIKEIFSKTSDAADGSMMEETWVHQDKANDAASRRTIYLANLGVVFLKSNGRTIGFMEALLKWASEANQDQYMVTIVAYQAWAPCADEATCLAVRYRNMAAITLHPAQFAGSNCVPEPRFSLCSWRRLYVHAVCRVSSRDKETFLRQVGAMFIPNSGAGGDGGFAAVDAAAFGRQDNTALAASGLPCPLPQQWAWRAPSRVPRAIVGGGGGGDAGGVGSGGGGSRLPGRALLQLRGRV